MNIHNWMSGRFFSFFLTWGIFLPYWTGWMISTRGITVSQASLIMGLGLVVRGLSTLWAFPYFSNKYSIKTVLNGMTFGTLLVVLGFSVARSFDGLLLATLLLNLFYPTLMPALDSTAGTLIQSKHLRHYGKARSWGSIGFVVGGTVLTFFTSMLGDKVILWAMLIGTLIFSGLSLMKSPAVLSEKPDFKKSKKSGMQHIFRIKHFGLVLAIVILLQAAHASYYSFGYIYLQDIHAPKYLIGVIINIAVIAEILFFTIADRYFHQFSIGSLLTVAALGSTARWIVVFSFPNVMVFALSQIFHAASFAMVHYAFMKYLIKNVPHSLVSKVQGLYSAFALSWGTAVLTIFSGFLYQIEPKYAFVGMVVCTVPALLLALRYSRLEQRQLAVAASAGL
ncbi:MFS transporter [Alicyclobacillus curvatus]|nr:MFS transporter [Alicyclobacillus curvatus]